MKIEEIEKIKKVNEELYQQLGREPLIEEICTEMHIDIKENRSLVEFSLAYENEEYNPESSLKIKMTIKNNEMEKARLALGLRQVDLAEKTEINDQRIGSIECCRNFPTNEEQIKISNILHISQRVLFPEWLKAFSEKWKRHENTKIVPIQELRLNKSPEFLMLESNDYEDIMNTTDSNILNKEIYKRMNIVLTPKEQRIIELRYGLDGSGQHTYEEVGREFGVTRERIRQLEAKAYCKLKEELIKLKIYG